MLALGVWEPAYWLNYPAQLETYIDNWFKVVNWAGAQERYLTAMSFPQQR
ncbi:Fe-Mn family superoxide dismutase [Hydrogenoanaerobacterium sp.]